MAIYHVSIPYYHDIWKGGDIIGSILINRIDADAFNDRKDAPFYIGFTKEEHEILRNGSDEELRSAGFLSY